MDSFVPVFVFGVEPEQEPVEPVVIGRGLRSPSGTGVVLVGGSPGSDGSPLRHNGV